MFHAPTTLARLLIVLLLSSLVPLGNAPLQAAPQAPVTSNAQFATTSEQSIPLHTLPASSNPEPAVLAELPPSQGQELPDPLTDLLPFPLPEGCGGISPPGQGTCCLIGTVRLDDKLVNDATVTVQSQRGDKAVAYTPSYSINNQEPIYRLSLSAEPLRIRPGETYTVTAEYRNRTKVIRTTAEPGSQRVNLVLSKRQAEDYRWDKTLGANPAVGAFGNANAVATVVDGNIYVTDGALNRVVVIDRDGNRRILPGQFQQPADIALDQDKNVYVLDKGNNRVQKFTSNDQWVAAWGASGIEKGLFTNPQGVVVDQKGFVYIADAPQSRLRIQRFSPYGTWQNEFRLDTFGTPSAFTIDTKNNIYVANTEGRISIVDSQTGTIVKTWNLTAFSSSNSSIVDIAVGIDGNIYIPIFEKSIFGKPKNYRVQVYSPGGVLSSNWGTQGYAPGMFWELRGLAVDKENNIYVADTARVQKFLPDGKWLATWGDALSTMQFQMHSVERLAIGPGGTLYGFDLDTSSIASFAPDGKPIRSFQVTEGIPAALATDGYHIGSSWNALIEQQSKGLAIAADGTIYTTDGDRILKLSPDGVFISTWGSRGSDDGQFIRPKAITIDRDGSVFVLEGYPNNRLQKFDQNGAFKAVWGKTGTGNGQLDRAEGIAVDQSGNIYIADTGNHRIQKWDRNGQWIASWGGYGSQNNQYSSPRGLAVAPNGNIYIADTQNNRIQYITSGGQWLGAWGTYGNGQGQLIAPQAVIADSSGKLYVADTENKRVQVFSSNGGFIPEFQEKQTAAKQIRGASKLLIDGSDTIYAFDPFNSQYHVFDQKGDYITSWGTYGKESAELYYPLAMTNDRQGNVFVVDLAPNGLGDASRIRKFDSSGSRQANWASGIVGDWGFTIDMAADSAGNVYALQGFGTIIKVPASGANESSWNVSCPPSSTNCDFNSVAVDSAGNVYVGIIRDTARQTSAIQKLNSNGQQIGTWLLDHTLQDLFVDTFGNVYALEEGFISKYTSQGQLITRVPCDCSGSLVVASDGTIFTIGSGNKIQPYRPMTDTKPYAAINAISSSSLVPGDVLRVVGSGQDSDETPVISAYEWTSDQDGVLGNEATLTVPASKLSPGNHWISLRVQDNEGKWSQAVSERTFVSAPSQASWTMLLYLAGDYQDGLFGTYQRQLDALRNSFANRRVRIAVQIDGPNSGDTSRWVFIPGNSSDVPTQLLGEQPMDDPKTLSEFVLWGQKEFPADHYYLAIANHGQGLTGIAWDQTTAPDNSAYLTPKEIAQALGEPGIAPIDILHLDACSMGLLEVAYELRNSADILIASQFLSWSFFAYYDYQKEIKAGDGPEQVARYITETYSWRAASGYFKPLPFTIAALDLRRIDRVHNALNALLIDLTALINREPDKRELLADVRRRTQMFDSNINYRIDEQDEYIDLQDWATNIGQMVDSPSVQSQAKALVDAISGVEPFVLSSPRGSGNMTREYANGAWIDLRRSNGISIFYPSANNTLAYASYISNRLSPGGTDAPELFSFIREQRWRDFLLDVLGTPPSGPLLPLPGPGRPLDASVLVFVPIVRR